MFSLRFLAVREVLPTARSRGEEDPPLRKMTWSVQAPGGPQNSGFVELQEDSLRQLGSGDKKQQQRQKKHQDPDDDAPPKEDAKSSAAASSPPLWPKKLEIPDREEDQDTMQVALVCELEATATKPRERFCHSIATIDLIECRHRPDEKFTFWKPLRPAMHSSSAAKNDNNDGGANDNDDDLGAIQLSITYFSDDCVDQGYWFALFCGLVPLPVILLLASNSSSTKTCTTTCSCSNEHDRGTITITSGSNPAASSIPSGQRNDKKREDKVVRVAPGTVEKQRTKSTAAAAAAAARPLQMRIEVQ